MGQKYGNGHWQYPGRLQSLNHAQLVLGCLKRVKKMSLTSSSLLLPQLAPWTVHTKQHASILSCLSQCLIAPSVAAEIETGVPKVAASVCFFTPCYSRVVSPVHRFLQKAFHIFTWAKVDLYKHVVSRSSVLVLGHIPEHIEVTLPNRIKANGMAVRISVTLLSYNLRVKLTCYWGSLLVGVAVPVVLLYSGVPGLPPLPGALSTTRTSLLAKVS